MRCYYSAIFNHEHLQSKVVSDNNFYQNLNAKTIFKIPSRFSMIWRWYLACPLRCQRWYLPHRSPLWLHFCFEAIKPPTYCPFNKIIPYKCICCSVTTSHAKTQTRAPIYRSVGSARLGPSSQTFISPGRSHVWAPTAERRLCATTFSATEGPFVLRGMQASSPPHNETVDSFSSERENGFVGRRCCSLSSK